MRGELRGLCVKVKLDMSSGASTDVGWVAAAPRCVPTKGKESSLREARVGMAAVIGLEDCPP
jgi:hypothetical protein